MTSQGLVYVDQTVEEYGDIRLPSNWKIHYEPKWGSIAASMRYCRKRFPRATQYGWLADDQFPRTEGWDKRLEKAAGDWFVSCGRDFWLSELNWRHPTGGPCFTAGLCWGREIIRAAGWWALPGVYQGGIDGAWNDLAGLLGLTRYLHDVVIEHMTWKLDKRAKDENDEWVRGGENIVGADMDVYYRWVAERRDEQAEDIRRALPREVVKDNEHEKRKFRKSLHRVRSG